MSYYITYKNWNTAIRQIPMYKILHDLWPHFEGLKYPKNAPP